MCPPTYYGVKYSINPWMKGEIVDQMRALDQWGDLKDAIEKWGVQVDLLQPNKNLPDMVFTANGALVRDDVAVLSNFKHDERIGEYSYFRRWFMDHGYNVHTLGPSLKFEGAGDAIIHRNTIIGGYGFRSELKGLEKVADILNMNLVPLKLKDPRFYHLDTCLALIDRANGFGIYYPGAFEAKNVSTLTSLKLLKIPEAEAEKFVCNSIAYDSQIIMPANNKWTAGALRKLNYQVTEVETSEYLKAGGSAQCLSLWV